MKGKKYWPWKLTCWIYCSKGTMTVTPILAVVLDVLHIPHQLYHKHVSAL